MLVLTRSAKETISIGEDITVTVCRLEGEKVRIGIDAPPSVRILRGELCEQEATRAPLALAKAA